MPTTGTWGLTYPASTGHTRIWEHIQTLAEDVDTDLTTLATRGHVGKARMVASVGPVTSTETLCKSLTFTGTAAGVYWAMFTGQWTAGNADNFCLFRLRWASGATVTTAGTLMRTQGYGTQIAGEDAAIVLEDTVTPGIAGSVTIGMFIVLGAGTGAGMTMVAGANADSQLTVLKVG